MGAEPSWVQKARDRERDPRRKSDPTDGEGEPPTREEKLLAELLATNEELTEALRIYDEIERVGMENEVERNARERSRVEVRGNAQVRFLLLMFYLFGILLGSMVCCTVSDRTSMLRVRRRRSSLRRPLGRVRRARARRRRSA